MKKQLTTMLLALFAIQTLGYTQQLNVKEIQKVIDAHDWLMETPLGVDTTKRNEIRSFLQSWVSESTDVNIIFSDKIIHYWDCRECLFVFMSGWTKYALETKNYESWVKGSLEGTKSAIKLYQLNKSVIGQNEELEKLIQLQNDGQLEDFIKSNI